MSAPRPGHVSRGGERRRRPPGSAPARPELPPERPHRSSSMGGGRNAAPGAAPRAACGTVPGSPGVLHPAPRPVTPRVPALTQSPGADAPSGAGTTARPCRGHRDYNSQHALRHPVPVRREASAVAERVSPSAGRSPAPPPRAPLRRASGGGRRSGAAGFKSPIPSPRPCQPNRDNNESLQYEIEELKQKDLALDQEIAQLLSEGYSLEELEKHISLLHEYNDIKDAGQMLLGKLAVIRGVTTKQLYPEYDLELSD
ncbi:DNA repair protein SWI5 homolog [Pezoporus occidentalis]|uniref:DNA repair protein SWI5 homolog n=1 Tax=Pezoporus occidentalis TaxID=407982 RepID=UPI002F90AAFA